MAGSDIAIGAGKGAITGASSGAMIGSAFTPIGTIIGGIIGAVVGGAIGGYAGKVEGDAKDDMVAQQEQAADAQGKANESAARRQAAMMFAQASADPKNTSATMFTKVKLQREANTNYADIRDKAEPFQKVEKNQFYGKTATKAA